MAIAVSDLHGEGVSKLLTRGQAFQCDVGSSLVKLVAPTAIRIDRQRAHLAVRARHQAEVKGLANVRIKDRDLAS
ncbi:hypothetical protein D3C84_1174630 [compost metagenome]